MGEELKLTRRSILAGAAATGAIVQAASAPAQAQAVMTKATAADIAKLPRVKPKLVDPPFVHAHEQIATGGPKLVEFEMTIHEKKIVLDDAGTETFAFTFNGTVPGPVLRATEGDTLRVNFVNAGSHPHTIHFHGIHPRVQEADQGLGDEVGDLAAPRRA